MPPAASTPISSGRCRRIRAMSARVYPAVIAAQQTWVDAVFARDPAAVAVIESALIFEVVRDARARGEKDGVLADWRRRIDRILLVTAPDELKIARYVARINPPATAREGVEADARLRLSHQIPDAEKASMSDYVIDNKSDMEALRAQVNALWQLLKRDSNNSPRDLSLKEEVGTAPFLWNCGELPPYLCKEGFWVYSDETATGDFCSFACGRVLVPNHPPLRSFGSFFTLQCERLQLPAGTHRGSGCPRLRCRRSEQYLRL